MLLRRRYPAKDEGKDKDYMKNTEQILIRVPLEMKQAMQKLAAAERRDLANYIRILFEDTIEKHRAANQGAPLSDSSAKICTIVVDTTTDLDPVNSPDCTEL